MQYYICLNRNAFISYESISGSVLIGCNIAYYAFCVLLEFRFMMDDEKQRLDMSYIWRRVQLFGKSQKKMVQLWWSFEDY